MFDWSSVRVLPVAEPIAFTSLNAAVYSALSKAGGPSGFRNWVELLMAHGVMLPHCGAAAARFAGGVGLQSPGSDPGVYGTTALAPSFARRVRIAAPTVFPNVIPADFPGPSGTLDKLFVSAVSYIA
jgi:hypothetical protein